MSDRPFWQTEEWWRNTPLADKLDELRVALEAAWAEIEELKGKVAKAEYTAQVALGMAPTEYPKEAEDGQ